MTEQFRNQVLKVLFWGHGENAMHTQEKYIAVENAYHIACRNLPAKPSENGLFAEVVRLVRSYYPHILHWC